MQTNVGDNYTTTDMNSKVLLSKLKLYVSHLRNLLFNTNTETL